MNIRPLEAWPVGQEGWARAGRPVGSMVGPRNPDRDAEIVARLLSPERPTLTAVGAEYGITRERVRQIASAVGVRMADLPPRPFTVQTVSCGQCGDAVPLGKLTEHTRLAGHAYRRPVVFSNVDRDAAILAAAAAGTPHAEIGRWFGVTGSRISQITCERGLARYAPRGVDHSARNARIVAEYRAGASVPVIARRHHLSPEQTFRVLREMRLTGRFA